MGTNIIYNRAKMTRSVVFESLPYVGSCSPTDIDLCIEVGSKRRYLIGDFKEHGKELTTAQTILLERHCQAMEGIGYTAAAFLAWHPVDAEEIDAASALVARAYTAGRWVDYRDNMKTLLERYVTFFGIKERT